MENNVGDERVQNWELTRRGRGKATEGRENVQGGWSRAGILAEDPRAGWEAGCSAMQGLGGGNRNRGESGGGGRGMAGSMQGIVGSGEGRRELGGEGKGVCGGGGEVEQLSGGGNGGGLWRRRRQVDYTME